MRTTRLGSTGPTVSVLGLGAMGMSDFYGPADEAESLATLGAALDAGITLIDTGDFYGAGHNEMLIGRALRGRRDRAVLSVKFGALRDPAGGFLGLDARPQAVKNFCAYSLKRLGVDVIDIYRPSRVAPDVPIEDTVGAIQDLIRAGHVRHLGLSEAGPDTIRRAHAIEPVVDVQLEYGLFSRGIERAILPVARELGVSITAYGVLSRGLISGDARTLASAGGFRGHLPRFQGENLEKNLALVDAIAAVGRAKGATPAQCAIAWALSRGPDIVPLIGARKRGRLAEALGAIDLAFTPEDLAALEAAVPVEAVAGTRYEADQMAWLDSERA